MTRQNPGCPTNPSVLIPVRSFWILHDCPGVGIVEGVRVLTGFDDGRTSFDQTRDLGVQRPLGEQIKMRSVLGDLPLGHLHEVQRWAPRSGVAHLEFICVPLMNLVGEYRRPPVGPPARMLTIHDDGEKREPKPMTSSNAWLSMFQYCRDVSGLVTYDWVVESGAGVE